MNAGALVVLAVDAEGKAQARIATDADHAAQMEMAARSSGRHAFVGVAKVFRATDVALFNQARAKG